MIKKLGLFLFVLLMYIPNFVYADGIENFYIDATIEETGDLLVQEYFNMTGEYNGASREINYKNEDLYPFNPKLSSFGGSVIHNGDGLEILEIRALQQNSSFDFSKIGGDKFSKVSSASKGDYGVYEESIEPNGKSLLIYNPSSKKKAFYIKYRIKNIAIRHNDVAELGWNIFNDNSSESVGNLKLTLHIPNNNNAKAWAHGPLNGNVEIVDDETILVTITNLSSYSAIDVRTTFDLEVINKSTKITNVAALDKIILYENDQAAQANYERENKELINQQNALEHLNRFEINLTRYNYEYALEYINKITDENVKNEYLKRLKELKVLLDIEEEKIAKSSLESAQYYSDYYNYENAKENIEILDNLELKKKLLEELKQVAEIIKKAELKKEKTNLIIGACFFAGIIIVGFVIYKKYRKDPSVDFKKKYLRDIPNDYSPEVISYLINKKVTNNALSAAILELIRKKVIFVEKLTKNNYKLTKNNFYQNEYLPNEEKLLKLIFNNNESIETKYISKYAKINYNSFISAWNSYQSTSLREGKNQLFYESDAESKKIKKKKNINSFWIIILIFVCSVLPYLIIFALISYIIYKLISFVIGIFRCIFMNSKEKLNEKSKQTLITIGLLLYSQITIGICMSIIFLQHFYKYSSILFILCFLISICLIPLIYNKKKKTPKGALEYKKWKALEKFLKEFGSFEMKEVMEIALWEKYLVYATLFGCAKKVTKVMKVEMVNMPDDSLNSYLDLYYMNRFITTSLRNSYNVAQKSYNAAHSSSSGGNFSSGSGGGGGLSSGGGSFGGGGSVGRF